jgi:transposase
VSMARLVITAVVIEGRSKSEVARDYGISRVWVQKLVHRFQTEGETAFTPRSRRPHGNPRAVSVDVEDRIVRLRKELSKKGADSGGETIAAHLQIAGVDPVPAASTIWRILSRRGFVRPQPQKRPRSSWRAFCAEQPNERWQVLDHPPAVVVLPLAEVVVPDPAVRVCEVDGRPVPVGEGGHTP